MWIGRATKNPRAFVAPAAAHFHPSVLLRRIRHRAARRVAGLGEFKGGQGEGVGRLQKIAGSRRLAAAAGTVCGGGLQVSIRCRDDQAVDSTGGFRIEEALHDETQEKGKPM
jgi:hypothetical protein